MNLVLGFLVIIIYGRGKPQGKRDDKLI